MPPFLKSRSRIAAHHYHEQDQDCDTNIDEKSAYNSLTVWRKSLIFSCNGFTVIGSDGSLVYRVDNYSSRPNQIMLMDAHGYPIFTISRPKKLRLVGNYWLIYEGEVGKKSSNKPIFCVRKNMSIIKAKPSVLAYVYGGGMSGEGFKYTVEGSYARRSCKIMDESRRALSEIKKKVAMKKGASFGVEVFNLLVQPGFDSRFAMAIVLLLDQMFP
ncbi:protein LURP-one-related 8-like [Salvia hispanica]|uniref:protein LURP-one-related 8-like n=1 Tax=Salvia hispanica TaxID=49212 RepID=UPI002009CB64|nr:protein LURP-one-related 8-like [Salvia hispanica]